MPAISLTCALVLVLASQVLHRLGGWKALVARVPSPALGGGYAAVLMLTLTLAPQGAKGFICFQF